MPGVARLQEVQSCRRWSGAGGRGSAAAALGRRGHRSHPGDQRSPGARMTFWQENYSFIREVYDTRYAKMVEWMDNVEMAIQKVCASKVYTSAEFKREKDNFHVNI